MAKPADPATGQGNAGLFGVVRRAGTFVRFSHTIFAMPFALGAMFVAADGLPFLQDLIRVVLCMVFARTAAMTFNRLADWEFDRKNPRTEGRQRLMPKGVAWGLFAISSALFMACAAMLNFLCAILAPVALLAICFYSLTKRFTHYTQFYLGLALAIAPVGGWLAVTGSFAWPPLLLAAGVLLWVAGFDLIYATQDYEFDRSEGLHSLVVKLGIEKALKLARGLHVVMVGFLIAFGVSAGLGWIYRAAIVCVVGALIYEHRCLRTRDLAAINRAFFNSNAFVGAVFVAGTLADCLLIP